MASSASLRAHLSASSSLSQACDIRTKCKQKRLTCIAVKNRKAPFSLNVKSVLDSKESIINGKVAAEPARALLQSLKQKLEEQIGRDPYLPQVAEFWLNLPKLESDLQAALLILKKKEEDLQDAERKVMLEYNELCRARVELETRHDEIAAASSKREKLEDDLHQANLCLSSRALEIEDLKFCLKDRDNEISDAKLALSLKEGELNKMKNSLMKKSEEAAIVESELGSKSQLLDEANGVLSKQKTEIRDLRMAIQDREKMLGYSLMMQNVEKDKLKVAEANVEKLTMNWLVTQEELKKLAAATSKHVRRKGNVTYEDFKRVKKLLGDVRSELLSSRRALASSSQKLKDQGRLLQEQLLELDEERRNVMSYKTLLEDAQIEIESEKLKLRLVEAQKLELERDLSLEKGLVQELQTELNKERSSLQDATEEMSFMQKELELKRTEFEEVQNLLKVKESELVEARLEIHHLKSEQASLQLALQEKDLELLNTRKRFDELSQEITELKILMKSKEVQLKQTTTLLKEKDEEVLTMHRELKETKLKFSEAETVVGGILELTNRMVISVKDGQWDQSTQLSETGQNRLPQQQRLLENKHTNSPKWQKRCLEDELALTRENLRTRDTQVLAAQMSLKLKDDELKSALEKLDAREKELSRAKEPKRLFSSTYDTNVTGVSNGECLAEIHTEVARLSALTQHFVQEAGMVGKNCTSLLHFQ